MGTTVHVHLGESSYKEPKPYRTIPNHEDGIDLDTLLDHVDLKSNPHFEVDADHIDSWITDLYGGGLLLLSSLDRGLLDSAGLEIVSRLAREREYTPRVLRSSAFAREDFVLDVEHLLVLREKERPTVILVEAINDNAEFFLKSVIHSPRCIARVTERLCDINRRLLILTHDRVLIGPKSRARFEVENRDIPYRYLPFLRPLLKERFPQDYVGLEKDILRQRKAGLWARDEEAFYWQVIDALALDELYDRIGRNEEAGSITIAAASRVQEPVPSAEEPLVTACLFVAAFYPRLPVQDFNRLVLSLLEPVPRKDTSSSYKFSHGQAWVEEQPEPKSDRDLWRESYQEVFKKCQLTVQPVLGRTVDEVCDSRVFIVDFQPPFAASNAREMFLGLHYPLFLELVRRLRDVKPSYLFDPISDIAKNAASLVLASAESNPGELQVDWLLQLQQEANSTRRQAVSQSDLNLEAESLKQEEEIREGARTGNDEVQAGVELGAEPKAEEEKEQDDKKQEQGGEETKGQVSYEHSFQENSVSPAELKAGEAAAGFSPPKGRFQDLLHEMMRRSSLRDTVVRFLHELFSRRLIGALIELTWSLRDVERFDAFKWWERLLNEGNKPTRDRVYSKILRMARNGEGTEVMPAVRAWLPAPKVRPVSLSSIAALYFYVDLNAVYLFDSRRRRRGWPPAHPVLLTLARVSEEEGEGLIRWLFHPGLAPILKPRAEDHFQEWVLFWLTPEPLRSAFFAKRHEDCRSALSRRWVESGEALLDCDCKDGDTLLFPALVLADWAVELLGTDDPPRSEACALFGRLISGLTRNCEPLQCHALGALWATIEESLLDLLVFMEELEPQPGLDGKTLANLREDLRTRKRCVKQLRLDLLAHGRAARPH